jgi:hypothetical protein
MPQHQTNFDDHSARQTLERILVGAPFPQGLSSPTYSACAKDGTTISIRSVGLSAGPVVVLPGEAISIVFRISGEKGSALDKLKVIFVVSTDDRSGGVALIPTASLETASPIEWRGSYRALIRAPADAGVVTIVGKVNCLPDLEDYVIVMPRSSN